MTGTWHHAPTGYQCPFCRLAAGGGDRLSTPDDVVHRGAEALAFISPRWWPDNHGHVLVIPTTHHENLYTLPDAAGHAVHDLVRRVALAIRSTYDCQGISVRQHNEPFGGQDAWHYHVHVFPRYPGDALYTSPPRPAMATAAERRPYAVRLREYLGTADPPRRS